jgi:hypothetical protein
MIVDPDAAATSRTAGTRAISACADACLHPQARKADHSHTMFRQGEANHTLRVLPHDARAQDIHLSDL